MGHRRRRFAFGFVVARERGSEERGGKGWKWHGGHEMKFISRTWVTDADVYGTIHNLGPGHERELGRFGGFAMLMKMGVGGSER